MFSQREVFTHILNSDTLKTVFNGEDGVHLKELLPKHKSIKDDVTDDVIR